MPDTLLFLIGLGVTALVGIAVWSVSVLDVADEERPVAGAVDHSDEGPS